MTETPNDGPEPQQPRFQFGIRSVLVLTTVCAAAAAIACSMPVPTAVQIIVAGFLILMAAYAVLRLPYICRRILQGIAGLKRLRRQRSDLEAIVSIMQQQLQQAKSATDTNSTPDPSSPTQFHLPRASVTTPISFGDNVCVRETPATTAAGLAGLSGNVYGHTTPSVTGVEVIGDLTEDFAVNVQFEDHGKSFWFAVELLEFVDHAPGTEIQLAGVPKKWVRTESGKWQEIELAEIRSETTAPAKRLTRFHQLLLIATFLPLCWLAMMAVHELGHVIGAFSSGGSVARVVLHPLTISRTDLSVNPHPLFVAWAGPVAGVLLPLVLVASVKSAGLRWGFLFQFFAGFCLLANGAYVGVGSFERIGDTGDMLRAGCPVWWLWLFGLVTVPAGLFLWHGLGPNFGLGFSGGKIDRRATYVSCGLLVLTVMLELVLSTR